MSERVCRYCEGPIDDEEDCSECCCIQCEEAQEAEDVLNGLRTRLAAAEAELADLKQRIAAAPVLLMDSTGVCVKFVTLWPVESKIENATRVRLLEVRDGE